MLKGVAFMEVSIRVVDEDGRGVKGARVFMSYPFTWQEDYTDDDGWVAFSRSGTLYGGIRTDVFVNSEKVGDDIWLEDGDTRSFAI